MVFTLFDLDTDRSFEERWRDLNRAFFVSVLGPCFLIVAALSFYYDEKAAPMLTGIASGVSTAARETALPWLNTLRRVDR